MVEQLSNMIRQIIHEIISPKCMDVYFADKDFFNAECSQQLVSKLIGYVILCISLVVKIPQILKIYRAKSGKGINVSTQAIEAIGFSSLFSYSYVSGYPFSVFGDTISNFTQTMVVVFLCLHYGGKSGQATGAFLFAIGGAAFLCSGVVPLYVLKNFNRMGFLMKFVGGSSQIYTNYKNQSTGQISIWSISMAFCIVTSKVMTALVLTKDYQLVIGASMGSCIMGTVLCQILYYSTKKPQVKKE